MKWNIVFNLKLKYINVYSNQGLDINMKESKRDVKRKEKNAFIMANPNNLIH